MIGKSDVYRRALRVLGIIAAMMISGRASAQETAVTRIDLPIGRAYPYRAAEVITRVTVANPSIADAVVVSEREIVVNAVAAGEGDLILWLQSGARVHFRVQVHTPADRMEGDIVTTQEIYRFRRRGISPEGRIVGQFEATGVRPQFTERLRVAGVELPSRMFDGVE